MALLRSFLSGTILLLDAQQTNLKTEVNLFKVVHYLNEYSIQANDYHPDLILNMDETPFYMDAAFKTTLDLIGTKSVDVCNTGHDKSRYTAVVTIAASGKMLPTYVILKNLVKVPKCKVPDNIVLAVSKSGSMDMTIMLDYLDNPT